MGKPVLYPNATPRHTMQLPANGAIAERGTLLFLVSKIELRKQSSMPVLTTWSTQQPQGERLTGLADTVLSWTNLPNKSLPHINAFGWKCSPHVCSSVLPSDLSGSTVKPVQSCHTTLDESAPPLRRAVPRHATAPLM